MGQWISGNWIADLSDGISLVDVDGKTVRVATSVLTPVEEEAEIMSGIRDVAIGFAVIFALLVLVTVAWKLFR